MDQINRPDRLIGLDNQMVSASRRASIFGRFGRVVHFLSYHFVLSRRGTWRTKAAGMRFTVRPTVFHPRYFISSERFAEFIGGLDLRGKQVIDVGTGSGILAIAAARAGSDDVIATDINPNAALSVPENARHNGVGDRIAAVAMDLLSGFAPRPLFDVIIANPPKHTREPHDLADRGWNAGPNHRDIAALFDQACERLKPDGKLYVMLSAHSELGLIEKLIERAGFQFRIAQTYSIFVDAFVLYECTRL
jgi:release factor glutamine methyltransferase